MLRLQMKIEVELPDGKTRQLSHSGSQPFSPEKLNDPAQVQMMQLQTHTTMLQALQALNGESPPSHPYDSHGATKLRQFAALLESGKYVTSFEKISLPDGTQYITLILDPSKC